MTYGKALQMLYNNVKNVKLKGGGLTKNNGVSIASLKDKNMLIKFRTLISQTTYISAKYIKK